MKKPGDMQKARVRHKVRQRLYDAVKAIDNLPDGETLEVRVHGHTYVVQRADRLLGGSMGLYVNNGRIGTGYGCSDDRHVVSMGGRKVFPTRIVARVVAERTEKRS